jgi:hypothetical protein
MLRGQYMSRFLKMFTATATVALVLIASIQAPTLAFTVDESVIASGGDASDVYTSAPDVTNTIDSQTVINGSVIYNGNPPTSPGGSGTTPNNVADVYKVSLSSGDFQVQVNTGFTAIIALFNSEGKGVYISDSNNSRINVTIDQAGVYYLGLSVKTTDTFSLIAVPSTLENGGDAIFPASYYNNNFTTPQPLQAPTSNVQGGYRFDGTTFPGTGTGYVATLTGTAVNVPEPAMAGTGFGFLALALTTGIGRRLRWTQKSGFRN